MSRLDYPHNYHSDCVGQTFLEVLDDQGNLREYMLRRSSIDDVLRVLAEVSESTPHPLIYREQVLDPEFVRQIGEAPRNEDRGSVPRFLVVDLDSFRSFVVD